MSAQGNNALQGSAELASVRDTQTERLNAEARTIDDRTVWAGKLVLNQLYAIAKLGIGAATKMTAEQRALLQTASREAGRSGEDLAGGVLAVMAAFDEQTVGAMLGVVLDQPGEWCGAHLGLGDIAWLAEAVVEHNDIEEVKAVFFRLASRLGSTPAPK